METLQNKPKPSSQYENDIDASNKQLGAVTTQDKTFMYFEAKLLVSVTRNYIVIW